MAQRSLDLIDAMYRLIEPVQPITGRGVGYKLFTERLIPSMATKEMAKVYRLLRIARERGDIPWEWIVDESRSLERVSAWKDLAAYGRAVARSYRKDFWVTQPRRIEVWSEKGTVRGVLQPVLDDLGVGFRVMHGFGSATEIHGVAEDNDGRPLIALYVGDYDPSGMYMSEVDLPERLDRYDGYHVEIERVALTATQLAGLPSFPATDKVSDPRYGWFVANYGRHCWELDAMDPNDLRDVVRRNIMALVEPTAWRQCEIVNAAEEESLRDVLSRWGAPKPQDGEATP
jgi:hypothetical protein